MKQGKTKRKSVAEDPRVRVCARVWINIDGRLFLGPGKVRLLQAVDEVGSISGAARHVGLSYRAAWNHIDAMNNRAGTPLVISSAGGDGGGGAHLTGLGRKALEEFIYLENELERFRRKYQTSASKTFSGVPTLKISSP